jgi:hypothetical protein
LHWTDWEGNTSQGTWAQKPNAAPLRCKDGDPGFNSTHYTDLTATISMLLNTLW